VDRTDSFCAHPAIVWTGLVCDDYGIRAVVLQQNNIPGVPSSVCDAYNFVSGNTEIIRKARETGLYPWWMPDEFQLSFWRPLACLTHWIDFVFFAESPGLMHLHSILWYAVLGSVVALAFRRFITVPWVAGLAAFMYVADETRAIGVGWLAGRSTILATIIGLLVLLAHDRWRRSNWKPGAVLAVLWLTVGLFTAESILSICAYLLSYALFIDRGKFAVRMASLLPYGIIVTLWSLIYNRLGYKVVNSGLYLDPCRDFGRFIVEFPQRFIMILYTQFALPDAVLCNFMTPFWSIVCLLFAAIVLAFIARVLWPFIRTNRVAQFFTLGMVLSALPVCMTLPSGRMLFFVGFGGMGLIALFLANLFEIKRKHVCAHPFGKASWCTICYHSSFPCADPSSTRFAFPYFMGRPNVLAAKTVPEPLVENERLVFVNVPSSLMMTYLPYIRESLGNPVPAKKMAALCRFQLS